MSHIDDAIAATAADYLAAGDIPEVPTLSVDERQAIRAYLQRAETRISTYQRVAGVFLNGAGLLILLPVLSRDAFSGIVGAAIESGRPWPERLLAPPWIVTIAISLWAFYLLV